MASKQKVQKFRAGEVVPYPRLCGAMLNITASEALVRENDGKEVVRLMATPALGACDFTATMLMAGRFGAHPEDRKAWVALEIVGQRLEILVETLDETLAWRAFRSGTTKAVSKKAKAKALQLALAL